MPELNANITVFERDFDVFDNAANGGARDKLVSREDIEAVANGQQYSTEQRTAARYLLDHKEDYTLLDTGKNGGQWEAADGTISRGDVDAVMKDAPLFAKTGTFASDRAAIPEGTSPGFDSPAEAAAQTEHVRHAGGDRESMERTQFMSFVREHKDDGQWLSDYFGALGAEKTAQLLSGVAHPGNYGNISASHPNQVIGEVRTALTTMYEQGTLKDADIARLTEHWALERGEFNSGVAQLFGGLDIRRESSQGMQNAFATATMELAMHKDKLTDRNCMFSGDTGRLNDGDRESLAGASAYVLGQTGFENRTSALIDLQKAGGDGAVDRFITLAMSNPTKVDGFTRFTYEAQDAHTKGKTLPGSQVEYDGVANLVDALSYDTTYRGGPDRYIPPAPYSYQQLQDIRDRVFYSASNGLDANPDQWQANGNFKDGLSRILMADFDRMVGEAKGKNGAQLDDDHPLPKALENYSQNVLFTEPSGTQRDAASAFLVDRLSTIVKDANSMNEKDFTAKYDADKTQMSHLAGNLLGHVSNGMNQAVEVAGEKYKAEQEALQFGIDLAWSLGQDVLKLAPGGNVMSKILPDSVTNSAAYEAIKGEVETHLKQGMTDKAADLLLEKFPDLKADAALAGLRQELSEEAAGGTGRDYLSALLTSYNTTVANPAAPPAK
jgi:hypothetical protein